MSNVYQILTEAQDVIRDPKHWTQGAYARNELGLPVGARDATATCWCVSGAIIKCGGGAKFAGGVRVEIGVLLRGEPAGLVHTNDDKGHDAVMALLDRLREKAKALEVAA